MATFVVIGFLAAAAPARAGQAERFAVQRLSDALPRTSGIVIDPATDAIEALRGLDEPLPGALTTAEAVRAWVRRYAPAFGVDTVAGDVVVERDERLARGGRRILLRQTWHGIPVDGADARAVVSGAGKLRAVAAGFLIDLAPPAAPRLGRTAAVRRAVEGLATSLAQEPAGAELRVRRTARGDRLAWRVRLPGGFGPGITRWVDAETGACTFADESCARAIGLVYPTDPRAPLAEVPLERLLAGPGLRSRLVGVEDQVYPLVAPLGPDEDYRFGEAEHGFNQVNAYWHADRFLHDELGALGYAGPPESVIVRVNAALEPYVALTTERYVLLGHPIVNFSLDPARASDIMYHEFTHAVLYGAGVQPGGIRRESGALHEGLADYLAAAVTGDPAIGEWVYLTFPLGSSRVDQPANPWHERNYDAVSFAGAPRGSTWANGMILSGALWDLRAVLGRTCDSLVVAALDYLPTLPRWTQFANALMQANEDHHAGAHRDAIAAAFANRGIRGTTVAMITGPVTVTPGDTARFLAEPCCDGAHGLYVWRARNWCRGAPCGDWRELGSGASIAVVLDEDTEVQLEAISAWGDHVTASRFVGVRLPTLFVEGPRRVLQHTRATWTARAAAMGPVRIQWQRRWLGSGPIYEYLGEGQSMAFAADLPCELQVTLVDGLLRVASERLTVEAFVDRPPPEDDGVLSVRQRPDARAHQIETTVQLPRAGPVRMRVYDVRGRLRARLWDGPFARGAHVIRWDATALEPGIYLLRVEADPTGTVLRFVLTR